ncbi:MAG: hypothetical protein DWI21_06790 [Planctomycetota bacterium]|nr:MAG: hypothetical protein DWI21_06790 [Planctomycetota bacterium]
MFADIVASGDVFIMSSTSELSEHRHAVVPVSDKLSPTILSPSVDLANSASALRRVVHADLDRISEQFVGDEWKKLCSESRLAMRLLAGQTDLWQLLLRARGSAASFEVLLFAQEVRSAIGRSNDELLLIEVKASANRRSAAKSGTQHRQVRLQLRFPGDRVARSRAATARSGDGDFIRGSEYCVCRAPR